MMFLYFKHVMNIQAVGLEHLDMRHIAGRQLEIIAGAIRDNQRFFEVETLQNPTKSLVDILSKSSLSSTVMLFILVGMERQSEQSAALRAFLFMLRL